MQTRVHNCKDPYIKELLKLATANYANRLMKPRITKDLKIVLHLGKTDDMDEGDVSIIDIKAPRPRHFRIGLRKTPVPILFSSLAHEMVHVSQWAQGHLSRYLHKWKGELITEEIDYWDTPWEIEAYGRERGMYVRFMREHHLEPYFHKHQPGKNFKPTY